MVSRMRSKSAWEQYSDDNGKAYYYKHVPALFALYRL